MDAPRLTPSMRIALDVLQLDRLLVFYPGDRAYPLGVRVQIVPVVHLADADTIRSLAEW